jgi:transposase
VLKAKVHVADVFDRDGIKPLLEGAKELFPRMRHLWLDAGYNGKEKGRDWVEKVLGWTAEIVKRPRRWVRVLAGEEPPPYPKGFIVLPRRWVVERNFSWTDQNRRMSKDYERAPETGEALPLCGDDALDGEAFGPLMRPFRRFLRRGLSSNASTAVLLTFLLCLPLVNHSRDSKKLLSSCSRLLPRWFNSAFTVAPKIAPANPNKAATNATQGDAGSGATVTIDREVTT